MIANVLKRLRPPPPAAATCPAREHVPSPVAPCPAPRVGPGCAAAASRRDGHLGQTELFIQLTSLKLQELRAAPRSHRVTRWAAAGGSASACSAPHGPHAVPCHGGQAAWHRGPGARLGRRQVHVHMCTLPCQQRAQLRAGGGARTGSRGGAGARLRCPGRCAHWHPMLCRDACVCMCVHACAHVCSSAWHYWPCQGQSGAGGVRAGGGREGAWPVGSCTPNANRLRVHSRALATSLPRHGGLCGPRGPGQGSLSRSDGGALPGKQEAPPGNEHHRFHSNLKDL